MAKIVNTPPSDPDPLVTLNEEALKHIENLQPEIDRVRGDLAAMEELELDTSRLKERVDWAEKARKIILERFAPKT